MKKIILVLAVFLSLTSNSEAQDRKGEEFIFFRSTSNLNNNTRINYFSGDNRIVSLLAIKAINKETAWRLGLGYRDFNLSPRFTSDFRNDTTFVTATYRTSYLPHLIGGKEWRKYLHQDVMIIGGVDAVLGAGPSERTITETSYSQNAQTTNSITIVNNGLGLYSSIAPFTGIRVSWNRLALAYSLSAPGQIIYTSGGNANNLNFDLSLKQNLSIGYRFYNKKPIRR